MTRIAPNKIPSDVEKMIIEMYQDGTRLRDIIAKTNVSARSVSRIIERNGGVNRQRKYSIDEKNQLIELYSKGECIFDISKKLNLPLFFCKDYISRKIKKGEIKKVCSDKEKRNIENRKIFCELYEKGLKYSEIAEKTKVHETQVRDVILKSIMKGETKKRDISEEQKIICKLYEDGLSYSQISREVDVPNYIVRGIITKAIIQGRIKKMEKVHPELVEGTTAYTIRKLYTEGLTQAEIARKLKINDEKVSYHIFQMKFHGTIVEKTLGETIADDPKYLEKGDIPGSQISKSTVQIGPDGDIQRQWVRLVPEAQDVELWLKSMEERAKACAVKPLKITKDVNEDLMLEIPMADVHMGALAWDKETRGDNYDVKIAKEVIVAGFGSILSDVPKVGKIVIVTLGDFYHADNKEGTTSRSGNILDTDSRFAKRVDYGINALKECIELASTRAKNVEVIVVAGNHDDHSATWLPRVLAGHYIQNPQIHISTDVAFRQYVEHGKVMLTYIHGHEMKTQRLVNLIPAEQPEMWGRTKYRYARLGHWHHRQIEEFQGITVETIPTVAAPDSYAAQHGFMSRRAMVGYLYHGEFGLRSKFERSIEEIKSYAKKKKK